MDRAHTARLLENAERRLIVLERICKQQETDLVITRLENTKLKTNLNDLDTARKAWQSMPAWKRLVSVV